MSVQIRPKQSSLTVKVDRTDHENLTKRNNPNQHSIEAITGLAEALTNLNTLIIDLQGKVDVHDDSSATAIAELAEKLTNLINEEKDRSESEDKALRDSVKEAQQDIIALGNEFSTHINTFQDTQKEIIERFETEHERSIKAEDILKQEIIDERDRALDAEASLNSTIAEEASRARKEEANILKTIGIKENIITDEISAIKTSIGKVLGFDASNKADLVDGKVPLEQLPENYNSNSIISGETIEDFPEEGNIGNLYVSTSNNIIYR
jgi:hypothetical protein